MAKGDGSDAVQRALQQAAERAARYAELDSAVTGMERLLNYSLAPEMLPWGLAMSTSYFPTGWSVLQIMWWVDMSRTSSSLYICMHALFCHLQNSWCWNFLNGILLSEDLGTHHAPVLIYILLAGVEVSQSGWEGWGCSSCRTPCEFGDTLVNLGCLHLD